MNVPGKSTVLVLLYLACVLHSCEKKEIPVITTSEAEIITTLLARCGGTIISEGSGTVTDCGICWGTDPLPDLSDNVRSCYPGPGSFSGDMTGMKKNTPYYVRAYATNEAGTAYGEAVTFALWINVPGPAAVDADGNLYSTVRAGSQVWMAENLRTTKYRNGTSIPLVSDAVEWQNLTTGAYCWYNNEETTYNATYGALYNWYSVNTGLLCPAGWHVPTDAEWAALTLYAGDQPVAGGKLKESGTGHWDSPNTGATDEFGFTALPGGDRGPDGLFYGIGVAAYWWTSTPYEYNLGADAWYRRILNSQTEIEIIFYHKTMGQSIRCVMD